MQKLFDLAWPEALRSPPICSPPASVLSHDRDDSELFRILEVNPDTQYTREISVVPDSFTHDGAPEFKIPDRLIHFDPPQLKPPATQLQICVFGQASEAAPIGGRSAPYLTVVSVRPPNMR